MDRERKKGKQAVLMPHLLKQSHIGTEMLELGGWGRGGITGDMAPQFLYVAVPQGYFWSQFVHKAVNYKQ